MLSYLFSGWKTKQKKVDFILFSADMRQLFGRRRTVMQHCYYREIDSYKPCMASFWLPSHIIILYAIYIYNAFTQNNCFVKGSHKYDEYLHGKHTAHLNWPNKDCTNAT